MPGGITVKTSLVEVDTVVRDDAGRSVAGLKAEDFAITDNGKPQKVSGFTVQTLVHASADSAAGAQPGRGARNIVSCGACPNYRNDKSAAIRSDLL